MILEAVLLNIQSGCEEDFETEVPPAKKSKLSHWATLSHFLVALPGYNRGNLDVARVSVDLLSIARIARSRYSCNTYMGTYYREVTATNLTGQEFEAEKVHLYGGTSVETAFKEASSIISSMSGYLSHELHRCLEVKGKYLLLVKWEQLEDHTIGFRESAEYQQWKRLLHHFYEPFPTVEHFQQVELDD